MLLYLLLLRGDQSAKLLIDSRKCRMGMETRNPGPYHPVCPDRERPAYGEGPEHAFLQVQDTHHVRPDAAFQLSLQGEGTCMIA